MRILRFAGKALLALVVLALVGWLVFNRPKALNAMNATMMSELKDAWLELDRDPSVRVTRLASEAAPSVGAGAAEIPIF